VVGAPALLGDRLVDEAAKADDDELQQEAVGALLEQNNLLLCGQTGDSCCISTHLCRWTPNAPPHGIDGTFL
jgi:hypothetical protein